MEIGIVLLVIVGVIVVFVDPDVQRARRPPGTASPRRSARSRSSSSAATTSSRTWSAAVKGYMDFEQDVLTRVTEARANAVAAGATGTPDGRRRSRRRTP